MRRRRRARRRGRRAPARRRRAPPRRARPPHASTAWPCACSAAHAHDVAGGIEAKHLVARERAGPDGAGGDGAGAANRERAIDRHAEQVVDYRAGTRRAARGNAARSSSMPAPLIAETAIDSPRRRARCPPARPERLRRTRASHSSSTRSRLRECDDAAAHTEQLRMARCSRVCGMTPSSAAMTRSARSIPVAPATIVRTNASWPGTSITPIVPMPSSAAARSRGRS